VPLRKGGAAIRGQGTGLKIRRYKGKTQTNGVMGAAREHDVSCPYLGEAACRGVEEASGRTLVRAVGVCGEKFFIARVTARMKSGPPEV